MSREALKYLHDVLSAASLAAEFVAAKRFRDYEQDAMLRSAVERQLEIVGEALNQLSRKDSELVHGIRAYQRAISFRNILIHGYADVDDEIVWRVVQDDLPELRQDVQKLMDDHKED